MILLFKLLFVLYSLIFLVLIVAIYISKYLIASNYKYKQIKLSYIFSSFSRTSKINQYIFFVYIIVIIK